MPEATGKFEIRGGCGYGGRMWVVDGPDGLIAGEFPTEAEAESAAERWERTAGRAVKMSWTAPPDDAPDSNRGSYVITLEGVPGWRWRDHGGWHAMEQSIAAGQKLYEAIATYGLETVRSLLNALPR